MTIPIIAHANANPNLPNDQRNNGYEGNSYECDGSVIPRNTNLDNGYMNEGSEEIFCELRKEMREFLVAEFGYEFLYNQDAALETVEELYIFFTNTYGEEIVYPDYFGGKYINEYGHLVLLKVESWYRGYDELKTFYYFSDTLVKGVEFPYNNLVEVMDLLDDKVIDWTANREMLLNSACYKQDYYGRHYLISPVPPHLHNVAGWRLDVVENRIIILLIEYSPEAIEEFRNYVIDSPTLLFEQNSLEMLCSIPEQPSTPIKNMQPPQEYIEGLTRTSSNVIFPGDPIKVWRETPQGNFWVGGNAWRGSIGYRAVMVRTIMGLEFRDYGFVTAAHIGAYNRGRAPHLLPNDAIVCVDNFIIGRVQMSILNGRDFSFVRLTNPNRISRLSNDTGNGQGTTGGIRGQAVAMRGGFSGWRRGEIRDARVTQRVEFPSPDEFQPPFWIMNASRTTHGAVRGDSGSPVFVENANRQITAVLGIHIGRRTNPLTHVTYSYVSRADEIRNVMADLQIRPRN